MKKNGFEEVSMSRVPRMRTPIAAGHVLESSAFRAHVVSSMAGLDMLIVGPAFEHYVTVRRGLAGVRVVGDFIGMKNVDAVMNLSFAMQLVDGAGLFLRSRADGYVFLFRLRRACWAGLGATGRAAREKATGW